jgi:hypothetical protein
MRGDHESSFGKLTDSCLLIDAHTLIVQACMEMMHYVVYILDISLYASYVDPDNLS